MSEKEYKNKVENMFIKNSILINENEQLKKENEDLKTQIKGFEKDFDYQNKVIDRYKKDLKELRLAFIQLQVSLLSGSATNELEKILNIFNIGGKI